MEEVTQVNGMFLQVPAWSRYPWLRHGFSTRSGGVSEVYGRSGDLNTGWTGDDAPENVRENRRRLVAGVAGGELPLVTIRQVHGGKSLMVGVSDVEGFTAGDGRAVFEADGLMTGAAGIWLGIQTADCVPVFVADKEKRVVAAFHAGWRGTAARIVEHGVEQMEVEFGCRSEDLIAAVGPSIGACCYTVGEQVRSDFMHEFAYADDLFSTTGSEPGLHLDLWRANHHQLVDAGVNPEQISIIGECTNCTGAIDGQRRYFSHRGELGFTGRMMNMIGVDGEL